MTKPFKVYFDEAIARLKQEEALRLARQAQAEERSPLSLLDAKQIWELARYALSGQPVEKIHEVIVSERGTILIYWSEVDNSEVDNKDDDNKDDDKDTWILSEYTY